MTKVIFKIIIAHFFWFITGTGLFFLLFRTPLFSNIDVFFYRGIVILILTCLLSLFGLILFKRSVLGRIFDFRDIVLSVVLIFSFNLVFFTHLPVTAERSVSIFILKSVSQDPDLSLDEKEITKLLIDQYLGKEGAIEKRLHEQIISGNITKVGNGYQLTKQGYNLLMFYSQISNIFGINSK